MYTYYLKLLQWLCRRELRRISDKYPHTRKELITYYDMLAIECLNDENPAAARIRRISVSTANALESESWS